jgi:hypothetical protein
MPLGHLRRVATPASPDRATWAGRFGWLIGGILGTLAGFAATWVLEAYVLRGRVAGAQALATRASSVLVAGLFLAGALAGHAWGSRLGAARYRLLGSAAGVCLAAFAWALLVLLR